MFFQFFLHVLIHNCTSTIRHVVLNLHPPRCSGPQASLLCCRPSSPSCAGCADSRHHADLFLRFSRRFSWCSSCVSLGAFRCILQLTRVVVCDVSRHATLLFLVVRWLRPLPSRAAPPHALPRASAQLLCVSVHHSRRTDSPRHALLCCRRTAGAPTPITPLPRAVCGRRCLQSLAALAVVSRPLLMSLCSVSLFAPSVELFRCSAHSAPLCGSLQHPLRDTAPRRDRRFAVDALVQWSR